MKTKKALGGLFGLLGSFAGFPFLAGAPFFTDSLHKTEQVNINCYNKN